MASTSINEKIQEALNEGHSYEDIIAHLKQSDKPEHQSFLQGISNALSAPATPAATVSDVTTPFLNMGQKAATWAEQNPEIAVGVAAAPYVIKKGAQAIDWFEERQRKQEAHELRKQRTQAYQEQVAKQGTTTAAPTTDEIIQKTTQYELDPLQQERVREAKAKADLAEAKLKKMTGQSAAPAPVSPEEQSLLERSEKNRIAKQEQATFNQLKAAEANVPTAPAAAVQPPVATPAPVEPPAVVQPPAAEPVVTAEPAATPAETKTEEPKKNKGGRPPKTAVKPPVPESEVGLSKQQIGLKRHLETMYGGGEVGAKAYEQVKQILGYTPAYPPGQGGGLLPEETAKILQYRKENIAGPKINLTHDMKKVMKGAGGLAVLAAIPGFANAAQRKDYGTMADIATDFLVLPFAQSGMAGMPKKEEEAIITSKFKEAGKLGSPYRGVPPPGL